MAGALSCAMAEPRNRYRQLFISQLRRGLHASIGRLQFADERPEASLLRQACHSLAFALDAGNDWSEVCTLIHLLADPMEREGHRDEWIELLMRALEHDAVQTHKRTQAFVICRIGALYRMTNANEAARSWLVQALEMSQAANDRRLTCDVLNQLSYLETHMGNTHAAIAHAEAALQLAPEGDELQALAYSALGNSAREERRWQDNLDSHLQALAIRRKLGRQRQIGWSLQNVGLALQELGRFDEALTYFDEALGCMQTVGDLTHLGVLQNNYGLALRNQGHELRALEWFERADTASRAVGDKLTLARVCVNRGLVNLDVDRPQQAEACFAEALARFQEVDNIGLAINAANGLVMAYLAQRKWADAQKRLDWNRQMLSEHQALVNRHRLLEAVANLRSELESGRADG